jgi:hypothetical protein
VVESDSSDKIGIRTLIVSQLWQPSQEGLSLDELSAAKPDVPFVSNGVLLVGEETRRSNGVYKTTWTFEGIDGDGKSVTFKDRGNSLDYGFEPGFSQAALTLWQGTSGGNPTALQDLLTKYQGQFNPDNGEIIWPATLTSGNSAGGINGLSGANVTQTGATNPMFGIQDFFRMEGTYRFRYAALAIPESLMQGVGTVRQDLPGQPPQLTDGRNWLKAPPHWKRRGLIFDITEEYWVSGIGGWPVPIYGDGKNSGAALQGASLLQNTYIL